MGRRFPRLHVSSGHASHPLLGHRPRHPSDNHATKRLEPSNARSLPERWTDSQGARRCLHVRKSSGRFNHRPLFHIGNARIVSGSDVAARLESTARHSNFRGNGHITVSVPRDDRQLYATEHSRQHARGQHDVRNADSSDCKQRPTR